MLKNQKSLEWAMIIASESRIISSYKEALRIRQVFAELSLCRGTEKDSFPIFALFRMNEDFYLFLNWL